MSASESKDQVSSDLDQAQMLWVGFTHVSSFHQLADWLNAFWSMMTSFTHLMVDRLVGWTTCLSSSSRPAWAYCHGSSRVPGGWKFASCIPGTNTSSFLLLSVGQSKASHKANQYSRMRRETPLLNGNSSKVMPPRKMWPLGQSTPCYLPFAVVHGAQGKVQHWTAHLGYFCLFIIRNNIAVNPLE